MKLFGKNTAEELVVIAEIGVNHQGDVEYAKELIRLAAATGADAVKFQSYTPERYVSKENSERFKRVSRFALTEKDHLVLIEEAKAHNIAFFSTPLSEDWVSFLDKHCEAFKIASGDITFEPVIRAAAKTGKPIIISTGAAKIEEIDRAASWVKNEIGNNNLADHLVVMHCICAYPAPIEQSNILSIPFFRERYGVIIGYSNHVIEPEAGLAAVALGANIIEVHFTDKKTNRDFHDHALSFEPQDLKAFIKSANLIRASLGFKDKRIAPCEADIIPHVRKGVTARGDLARGHVIDEVDLQYSRPALTYSSFDKSSLIGRKLKTKVPSGFTFKKEDFS